MKLNKKPEIAKVLSEYLNLQTEYIQAKGLQRSTAPSNVVVEALLPDFPGC